MRRGAQRDLVLVAPGDAHAEVLEQREHRVDVADARDVADHELLLGQQRGRQDRQRGVLVARRHDRARERIAALYYELVHGSAPDLRLAKGNSAARGQKAPATLLPAAPRLRPRQQVIDGAEPVGDPVLARWRTSSRWPSPSSAPQCEQVVGAVGARRLERLARLPVAPCIAQGTTCSSRQNTAPRSPACSARRKPSVGSTVLPHQVHFALPAGSSRRGAPRIDSGRCPTGPGLSCSRATRRARSCSSRRCGCSTPTSAASRSSSSTTTSRSRTAAARTTRSCWRPRARCVEAGFGIKAATITPEGADDVGSPNKILREEVDGKVIIRAGPPHPGRDAGRRRPPPDLGRAHGGRGRLRRRGAARAAERRRGRVPHRAGASLDLPRGRRVLVPDAPRARTRACTAGRSGPSARCTRGC